MGSGQYLGMSAEDVARLVLDEAECSREDVSEWYHKAEPQDRARLLQILASAVHDDFDKNGAKTSSGSGDLIYRIGDDSLVRSRVRTRVPIELGMLVNADLALGPGGETLTGEAFE